MRRGALAGAAFAALLLTHAGAGEARAAKPPVVVLVLDEFPTTSLLGKNRRIDAARFPGFAALARASTWFRNATTQHDSTFSSVPSILDGRRHRYVEGKRIRPPRRSLTNLLAARGYRVRASVEARGVCPVRFCGRGRTTRYYLVRSRLARLEAFIGSIAPSRRPTLYLKHVLLPHVPWIYLPSGRQYLRGPRAPLPGLNSPLSGSLTLRRLAWQRHLLQVAALDSALAKLIRRLQQTGLWRRSLVVVVADHGISFRAREKDRRAVTRANIASIAVVPLFVKAPRQRRGRISRAYVRTIDVLPTIADLLNVRVPWRTTGRSAFSPRLPRRRTVRVATRTKDKRGVVVRTRTFQRRWSRDIRRQHAWFGVGFRSRRVFGGSHPSLVGRPLRRVGSRLLLGGRRVLRRGRVRAVVWRPRQLTVERRLRFRPSLIVGRIVGGARRARRDLAVVVNGRVGGVGRSFRLRGMRGERFAVLVSEALLTVGRNRVSIVSVSRRRGRPRLHLLGGA